jgi:hypothetical protein
MDVEQMIAGWDTARGEDTTYIHSRYDMHMVVPREADTPELQAAYDRALAASFTASRAGKALAFYGQYWERIRLENGEMRIDAIDIRKPNNPRARALIDAVVSLILH